MPQHSIPGTRINIQTWADPNTIEPQALQQLQKTAMVPFIDGLAVMPDVHHGKGSTVGSVIVSRNAVLPAAVGVDIGCVDADSEYLSPTGWRRIADYNGEPVMQYDPQDDTGNFVTPQRYVVRDQKEFLHFTTKYGIDQMLTPDHKVLLWRITGRNRRRVMETTTAAALETEHHKLVMGVKVEFRTTFQPHLDTKLDLSDDQIRVQVMVNADAHLPSTRTKATIRVTKPRKIERARELLAAANITYTEHKYADQVTNFTFTPPLYTKTYTEFWRASPEQLKIIAEECLNWDGNTEDPCFYTRDKESADFIQYAFTATGKRAVLRKDRHSSGALDYRVFAHDNPMTGLAGVPRTDVQRVPAVDKKAYCFTVPSGYWVMRRGANVVMTGNCGMAAVKTSLRDTDLPDDLAPIRHRIESLIPVGFNRHDTPVNTNKVHGVGGWDMFWKGFSTLHPGVQNLRERALSQMGTLGGNNHFCEVQVSDDGDVWLMLHSGSRNIGKELAERHISIAKSLPHNADLPDPDLAAFFKDTAEMRAYRNDLFWAQEFAARNRATMMALFQQAIRESLPTANVRFEPAVNVHHNYVAEEIYDGVEMLVTRKGAIRAGSGDLGIIPGSMGTGSYIARGLGNVASYNSASHGAGRSMSRNAAKKMFTIDDVIAQTAGVECRKDRSVIDEVPEAYKNIDDVIRAQSDLVEVVTHMKQVICVKG